MRPLKIVLLQIFFFVSAPVWAGSEAPAIEIRGDRTIIYPQRLELSGEETLLDILEMYPDLMSAGFDDLLGGDDHFDAYQLRLDNVAMSGNTRLLLTQIKARLISKIQVCDNAGVAKGRTGDGRVIDVNLLKAEGGAHGFVSLQGSTDQLLAPSANLRYGSEKTDIWSSMTYTHTDVSGQVNNAEHLHFQMTNRFSSRDRLLSYVTQSSSLSDNGEKGYSKHGRTESFMARFRYFHTFNEKGTELLTLLSWAHKNAPVDILDTNSQMYRRQQSHVNTPIWLLELNTPLFVDNLTMMLGYEGDLDVTRYGIDQQPVNGTSFSEESTYQVMNNDLYLQFNYLTGPLRLTVGDRIMFYHYQQKGYADNWSKNDTRNNFHLSAVLTPHRHHQVQLAYYRKFRNPSAMSLFPEQWPDLTGALKSGNPLLEETKTDQLKLAYGYHRPRLTATLGGNIYRTNTDDHYWTIDGGLYQKLGVLSLSGGFNICHLDMNGSSPVTFADVRLSPVFHLPRNWEVATKLIWYSKDAPRRIAADNTTCYASIQINKQFCNHWNLQVQWHDLFCHQRSACLAGVAFKF